MIKSTVKFIYPTGIIGRILSNIAISLETCFDPKFHCGVRVDCFEDFGFVVAFYL